MRCFALLVMLLSLCLTGMAEELLEFESKIKADRFSLQEETLVVRSRRGVGEVTVRPVGKTWPTITAIRFEYSDGAGMKNLQEYRISAGSPQGRNHYFNTLSKRLKNGAVELPLPPALPSSAPFIRIRWIDFYR